uniref:dihydrofolate reductase n=1 Tax=Polyopes affinis TaxID=194519 RepID=UPI002A8174F3|nr:dihydrofolate reductase [Polyopes affinis]WOL36969.1 dihydrofolate reductase [Polyopes affinis]
MNIMVTFNRIILMFSRWWSDINFKTRLMASTTLIVSLIMSSLTFWALTIVQEDSITTDLRFCKDLGILFASNVLELVESNNQQQLASVVEKIYLSTSSLRYILFFQVDGSLFFGLPVYNSKVRSLLQLHQNLFQLETQDFLFDTPLVRHSTIFKDNITDIIIPLTKNGKNLGSLDLGINSNLALSSSSKLISNISITIFVSIWFIVLIGAIFNTFARTEPTKELLFGIKNIASGNFNQRVNLPLDGELRDLIISFNAMAERLESYEKTTIDKLTLEKNKLEAVVSIIADGTMLVDTELRLIFANQVAIKAFNWTNIDIIGQSIIGYFPLHVSEALLPVLNDLVKSNCLDNSQYKTQELCIDFDYNSEKIFRFLLTTVLEQNSNTLIGVAIIIQDISREIKLNEAKTQFISNVSHELRTPLCNIGSFIETVIDYNNSLSDQQKKQFLTIANNETRRLSSLVNDILDLSRLESDNYKLTSVDLYKVLHSIISTSKLMAMNKHIDLILELDSRVSCVLAHESSLLQVIANLVSNAIKFTGIYGKIVLRVYYIASRLPNASIVDLNEKDRNQQGAELIRIEIIDEGVGINKRDQKHVFERFVRIENNIHTLEGTGLGLSIVQNILAKYNTQIMIQSQLFVGTSLWFDLFSTN